MYDCFLLPKQGAPKDIVEQVEKISMPSDWTMTQYFDTNVMSYFVQLNNRLEFNIAPSTASSLTIKTNYELFLEMAQKAINGIKEQLGEKWKSTLGPLPMIWFNDCPIYFPINQRNDYPWFYVDALIELDQHLGKGLKIPYAECGERADKFRKFISQYYLNGWETDDRGHYTMDSHSVLLSLNADYTRQLYIQAENETEARKFLSSYCKEMSCYFDSIAPGSVSNFSEEFELVNERTPVDEVLLSAVITPTSKPKES